MTRVTGVNEELRDEVALVSVPAGRIAIGKAVVR